ncbi:MAG: S8 family serine peptidase [Pseudoxanthomonas suwonensis]|nr:S8 family serine peptidase [Pseudoxanthomonas suwonensis]
MAASNHDRYIRLLALGALASTLVACGGGGGNNVRQPLPPSPPPAAPPAAPVVQDPDPRYSGHIALTNTAAAHAAGFTGTGSAIGVIDSGVNRNHPALSPRVTANLVYISAANNDLTKDDVVGHGTNVSQLAAGAPFGAWPGGIAPGATILSARIIQDKAPEDDGSGKGNEVTGALGLKPIHDALVARGMRIMNNSWGGLYWTNLGATAPIAEEYRPFILQNGGLVVFATGNAGFANPSSMAALPSQPGPNGSLPAADLERGWIAVTAVDPDNIHSLDSTADGTVYANACGEAMSYCMAAPGTAVFTGKDDGPTTSTYWRGSGTSYAAPQVSGAAALVWQAFPWFDNDLVRQTLLGTAKDIGDPGPDLLFGYGLLDAGKAVKGPGRFDWGTVTVNFTGTSTWANDIGGDGGLVKNGSGRLRLAGANAYKGGTTVNGGVLSFSHSAPSAVQVGSGGTVELAAGVSGSLTNGGVVATTTRHAKRNITGDFTQSGAGRLDFHVGNTLMVRGKASLAGTLRVMGAASGYTWQSRENVLNAVGGVSGTFSNLTAAQGVFLEGKLAYDPTNVWLDINRLSVSATAAAMGITGMSLSSAERLEGAFDAIDGGQVGGGGPGNGFLAGAGAIQRSPSAEAAAQTLASLSGELHAADSTYALAAVESGRHALEKRMDRLHDGGLAGGWGERFDLQRMPMPHFGSDASGWRIGQDFRLQNGLLVGGGFGQTDATTWHALRNDRERNRQLETQLYAGWARGGSYLLARGAHGRLERHAQRQMWLGLDSFDALSDYTQNWTSVSLQAGHRFNVGDSTRLVPYAGVQSLRLQRGGFAEHDLLGFGLTASESRLRASQALAGVRLQHDWLLGRLALQGWGRVEWQRTLSQHGTGIDARFNAIDVYAPIPGLTLSRDVGVVGFGVDAALGRAGSFSASLDARRDAGRTWTQSNLRWVVGF